MFVRRARLHIGLCGLGLRDGTAWGMAPFRPHSLAEISVTEACAFDLIVDANMKVASSGGVGLALVLDSCWPKPRLA